MTDASIPPLQPDQQARLGHAAERIAAGAFAEAEAECRALLDTLPGHPAVLRELGRSHLVRGDIMPAHDYLRRAEAAFADDPWFNMMLGAATRGAVSEEAAIPLFRRAVAAGGDTLPNAQEWLGRALLRAGQADEAVQILERSAAAQPASGSVQTKLGLALVAVDRIEEGLQALALGLQRDPGHQDAALMLSMVFDRQGRAEQALPLLQDALARQPRSGVLHMIVGNLLARLDRLDEARTHWRQAVALEPENADIWSRIAEQKIPIGDDDAIAFVRQALALKPGQPALHGLLAGLLYQAGQDAEADAQIRLSLPWTAWTRQRGGPRLQVAFLKAPHGAHMNIRFILESPNQDVELIPILEGVDYPFAEIDAGYDVAFNAISDVDLQPLAIQRAAAFTRNLTIPVLNRPEAVMRTTRDQIAITLSGIPGIAMPPTVATTRTALLGGEAERIVTPIGFPLLLRPTGMHGGDALHKLDSAGALQAHLAQAAHEDLYLTRFVEYASEDGLHRKYRSIFIDGVMYPYHLSIGSGWLNHYFRSQMAADAALRAEEERFLTDPAAALGETALTALAEIPNHVDLDYFGVDFSVDRQGRLLVFECNATMLVYMPQGDHFAYRREPVIRIRDAFAAMLRRHGGRGSHP